MDIGFILTWEQIISEFNYQYEQVSLWRGLIDPLLTPANKLLKLGVPQSEILKLRRHAPREIELREHVMIDLFLIPALRYKGVKLNERA